MMKFSTSSGERRSAASRRSRACRCVEEARDGASTPAAYRGPADARAPCCSRPLVLLGLLSLVGFVQAHQYSLGACPPEVPFKKSLDIDRFLGVWFVIQKSHSTMSCLKVNITRRGDEDLKITEYRRIGLLQKALDHTLIDVGVLRIPDPTQPAKMNVKFSLSAWTEPFTILDTDYETYAATFSCVNAAGMGNRKNGMILSRRPDLDNEIANKLRKLFESFGVDAASLSFVDQRHGCTGMLRSKNDHDRVISLGPLNINRKPEP